MSDDTQFETIPDAGKFVKFAKIGDSVTGIYKGRRDNPNGKFGPEVLLDFVRQDGSAYTINAKADLKRKIEACRVGNLVRITYLKDVPTGKGAPMKQFKVEQAPVPMAEVKPSPF